MSERGDNRYSHFVALAKVALPLIALALLSTVFLLARGPSGPSAIPYAEIEEIARDPRITAPRFSGLTDDGGRLSITARSAQPQGEGGLDADRLAARLETTEGVTVDMSAAEGEIDQEERTATLSGLTQITTSSGYMIETGGVTTDLDTGRIVSHGPLEARTPAANLTAGRVTFEPRNGDQPPLLVFDGGVTLVYQPVQGD